MKLKTGILFAVLSLVIGAHAGELKNMENGKFTVEFNSANGGLKALVLKNDADRMNWIEGLGTWGVPSGMEYLGAEQKDGKSVSRYRRDVLELTVERSMGGDFLRERFSFRNTAPYDLYFQRGELGVFATFNDNYTDAETCEKRRCNAHLWCGGENSYVHALKMGEFHTELALILTQGSLDTYSVRRIAKEISNDRGDFILHPAPSHFLPGETKVLEWELAAFPAGAFKHELLKRPNSAYLSFEQETVFPDERFRVTAECSAKPETAEVFCNGNKIPFRIKDSSVLVDYAPEKTGEHKFEFRINGRVFRANGFVSEDLETVVDRRIRFIIRKQQMTDPRSPLCGAYLIYDCEENAPYFDYANANHNACRERFGMGLLIARRLQRKHDDEMEKSLKLFEQFLLREVFDTETGEVCNNIGKNAKFKRLYNAPWLITFWLEMYRLYKDDRYLVWIERSMRDYYGKGGAKFYPNGSIFSDAVKAIRDAGKTETARELAGLVRTHVENIRANGILYPPHEVRFEQTIVTPALSILSAYYNLIERDPALLEEAKKHAAILKRFNGDQPDHKWNNLPIRHWDDYWFGKRALYGDTLHYWNCLSAYASLLHAQGTGDDALRMQTQKTLRNLLCLFFPDGTASCAYLHPYSVTMLNPDGSEIAPARRGEFFDPWANDQDFALYYILRAEDETDLSLKGKR